MFDFGVGYTEMVLIAVVAIIVIGPKDLPRVLAGFGKTMAKMRGMAREFQGHLDSAIRDAGLDEVKKDLQSLKNIGTIEPVQKAATTTPSAPKNDFDKYFGEAAPAAKAAPDAP